MNGDVDEDSYWLCPPCMSFTNFPPVQTKSTLIICPEPILHQWEEEIQKRVKQNTLKVLVYKGTQSRPYQFPTTLATYDIILTTYTILA